MPYVSVVTNVPMNAAKTAAVLEAVTEAVAQGTGKGAKYVMASVLPGTPMRFTKGDGPCAYVEVKSLQMPSSQTPGLTHLLMEALAACAGIDGERVYIEYASGSLDMWGMGRPAGAKTMMMQKSLDAGAPPKRGDADAKAEKAKTSRSGSPRRQ